MGVSIAVNMPNNKDMHTSMDGVNISNLYNNPKAIICIKNKIWMITRNFCLLTLSIQAPVMGLTSNCGIKAQNPIIPSKAAEFVKS